MSGNGSARRSARMRSAWSRLSTLERQVLCQVAGLVPGAALVDVNNLDDKQARALVGAMRFVVALADECRYALAYTRNSTREGEGRDNGRRV